MTQDQYFNPGLFFRPGRKLARFALVLFLVVETVAGFIFRDLLDAFTIISATPTKILTPQGLKSNF